MADRPAAELLAELDGDDCGVVGCPCQTESPYRHALRRLARAEQALADVPERLAACWDDGFYAQVGDRNPYRAALRASQGDSNA